MESQLISINIKLSAEKTFSVQLSPSSTILDLKKQCFEQTQAKPEDLKVIFKGKILKDQDVISLSKIENQSTCHLVVYQQPKVVVKPQEQEPTKEQPTQQPSQPQQPQQNPLSGMGGFGGMGGMGGLGGMGGMGGMGLDPSMMQGPQFQQMLQSVMSNPQMIQQMISSNPMLQQMISQNPQLQQAMSDPATLQMLSNPAVIQQAMQMAGSGQFGGMGGFGGLGSQGSQMPDLQGILNNFQNLQGQPQNSNPNQPPEERFKDQLQIMSDMGFTNKQANIDALLQTNGNVEAAIERLLNMLG